MARLASIRNVIAVHDVAGTVDGQDFVAMELVTGGTLDAWLRKERRPIAPVLDMFLQAARGLAAAARGEGSCHRDLQAEQRPDR